MHSSNIRGDVEEQLATKEMINSRQIPAVSTQIPIVMVRGIFSRLYFPSCQLLNSWSHCCRTAWNHMWSGGEAGMEWLMSCPCLGKEAVLNVVSSDYTTRPSMCTTKTRDDRTSTKMHHIWSRLHRLLVSFCLTRHKLVMGDNINIIPFALITLTFYAFFSLHTY